jgi:hypothetical protein
MKMSNKVKTLICAYVRKEMPTEISRLASIARMDLLIGPYAATKDFEDGKPWPGFSIACDVISDWVNGIPDTLWVDLDCEMVSNSEPEGFYDGHEWIEPCTENVWCVERKQILGYVFKELGEYL